MSVRPAPSMNKRLWIWHLLGCVILFAFFTFSTIASGQSSGKADSRPGPPKSHSHDFELEAIIDSTAGVAPEFGADVLIRIAESAKPQVKDQNIALLLRAFELAQSAETTVKPAPLPNMDLSTRSGQIAASFWTDLDGLSLQSRAIRDLLPMNSGKALKALDQVQLPVLKPAGCEEALTYDVSSYYRVLEQAANGPLSESMEDGRRMGHLRDAVGSLQSHAQVIPAAHLLGTVALPARELEELTNAFANALNQLGGDERSFTAVTIQQGEQYNAVAAVGALLQLLREKEISTYTLLKALRKYLVTNFSGIRCQIEKAGTLPLAVRYFNYHFQGEMQKYQIEPITGEEINGAHLGPSAVDIALFRSSESVKLQDMLAHLRFADSNNLRSIAQEKSASDKTTNQWSTQLLDFLTNLESWEPGDESEDAFFIEKCYLYNRLINAIPPQQPERSKVITSFVEFLEQHTPESIGLPRPTWLIMAEDLLSQAGSKQGGREVIQDFINSRDSALSLYGRLERWDARKSPDPLKASTEATGECNLKPFF